MNMKEFIIKAQIPLFSSDGSSHVLVYNEDRSIMAELPLRSMKEAKEFKRLMDDEAKGYFYAVKDGKGIIITRPAPWQNW